MNIVAIDNLSKKINLLTDSHPASQECQIQACNDLQAVTVWLNQYKSNRNTFNAYSKEAEKLILWCTYAKGLSLGKLKVQDFEEYCIFIQNPPPKWCATKSTYRHGRKSDNWRPFSGPINKSSFISAIRIINSLMNYLTDAQYIKSNPLKLIKKYNKFEIQNKYQVWERMLEPDEWQVVQQAITNLPESSDKKIAIKMRTKFLFAILYLLGLRIHEAVQHSWNAFRKHQGQWWFFVHGKGGKFGSIPVNDQLLDYMRIYRKYLNKTELPDSSEEEFIFSSSAGKPLSQRSLYGLIKNIGQLAAQHFPLGSHKHQKLLRLSPHWMRHLSASHQDKLGIPQIMIQANHRHTSRQTTNIYLHAEEAARFQQMQKMSMNIHPQLPLLPKNKQSDTTTNTRLIINFTSIMPNEQSRLNKFLQSIELYILATIKWEKHICDASKIIYTLQDHPPDTNLNHIVDSIIQEAEIRLFTIKISTTKSTTSA